MSKCYRNNVPVCPLLVAYMVIISMGSCPLVINARIQNFSAIKAVQLIKNVKFFYPINWRTLILFILPLFLYFCLCFYFIFNFLNLCLELSMTESLVHKSATEGLLRLRSMRRDVARNLIDLGHIKNVV